MKPIIIIIFCLGFFIPLAASAASCNDAGYTVVYVNGILTDKGGADKDRAALESRFRERTDKQDVDFITGYNASHLAGFGDLAQSISQTYGKPISSFNLNEILGQLHDQIHTRRVLLVGHSQGTFYTNELYHYLTLHGASPQSIAVYNLATPASAVAGNGQYLTSANDKVIALVRDLASHGKAPAPLLPNISIDKIGDSELPAFSGHDFRKVYLAGAADRIVGEVGAALDRLSASGAPLLANQTALKNDCFDSPARNALQAIEGAVYAMTDPVALGVKTSAVLAYGAGTIALRAGTAALAGGYRAIAAAVGFAKNPIAVLPPANKETAAKAFPIVKALYGSSLSQSDVADLLGTHSSNTRAADQNDEQGQAPKRNPPEQDVKSEFAKPSKTGFSTAIIQPPPAPQTAASTTQPPPAPVFPPHYQIQPFFSGGGGPPNIQPAPSGPALFIALAATSTATSSAIPALAPTSTLGALPVGTSTMGSSLSTAVASTTPEFISTTTPSTSPLTTPNFTAPFSDSFDTYDFGNLYAQGLWHNNQHVWEVTDQGCMDSGRCLASTGISGINWKSGADLSKGEWRLHFYAAAQFYPNYVGPAIYFGSAEHPEQSSFQILDDIPSTSTLKITDSRGNVVASGLSLGAWHAFNFAWDMGSTTDCQFQASVDGLSATSAAVGVGGPYNCYDHTFAEQAIGSLGLGTYYVGQGQFLIDNIEGGPIVGGCLVNCGGTTTPLTDSFDHFNDMGWTAPQTPYNSLRVGSFDDGSTGNCYSGGCVRADGWGGGFGGGGWSVYQYLENGAPKSSGTFTLWAKAAATSTEWSHVTGTIGLCEAKWSDCVSPWAYMFPDIIPNDGLWHQFYVAWQPALFGTTTGANTSNMEICLIQDSTSSTGCLWHQTQFPSGRGFDGLILSGTALRPDLGDHLWFDDLEEITH